MRCPSDTSFYLEGGIIINEYRKLKNKHQEEYNALPKFFAFSEENFEKGMSTLGLQPTNTDKIYQTEMGMFYRKEDEPLFKETIQRFHDALQKAISEDETGDNFIYQMFYTELINHEYAFTEDPEDALTALNLTWEKVQADPRLKHGFEKASKKFY